jgi:hypothetical protein
MFYLAKKFTNSLSGGLVAGLFYMLNPLVFNKIVAGHLGFMFSYALSPLVILLFIIGTRSKNINWKLIILSGILFGLAFAQHQFILFIPVLILVWFIANWIEKKKFNIYEIKAFLVFITISFFMHFFWILPNLFSSSVELNRLSPLSYHALENAPDIWQATILTGWTHPYDYTALVNDNSLFYIVIFILFLLIIFSISNLLFRDNYKKRIYLIVIFLIGIFLTTGLKNPGGKFFEFLYVTIPFLRIFRDSYIFTFLTAFSLSILLAFFVKNINSKINFKKLKKYNAIKIIFIFIVLSLIIISGMPILNGNFAGQIQKINLPNEYENIYNNIYKEYESSRILFLPSFQPIVIDENNYAGIDIMIHFPPKPSFPQFVDRLNRFNRFHCNAILNLRNGENIENLLNVTSTKYIVERKNFNSWYYKYVLGEEGVWGNVSYDNKLSGYDLKYSTTNISLYQKYFSPFIKITSPIIASGNLNLINSMPIDTINQSSIIYISDINDAFTKYKNFTLITNQDEFLVESFLCLTDFTKYIRFSTEGINPNTDWSYDDTTWRLYPDLSSDLIFNGLNNVITTSNKAKLRQKFTIDIGEKYQLFIRILNNQQGGKIKITIDNKIYYFDTKDVINHFVWQDLGVLNFEKGEHWVTIENIEGFNAISFISYSKNNDYKNFLFDFSKEILNNNIIYIFEGEKDFNHSSTHISTSFEIDKEKVLDLNSVEQAFKNVSIYREGKYFLGVKGVGDFDLYVNNKNHEFSNQVLDITFYGPYNFSLGNNQIKIDSIGNTTIASYKFENKTSIWGEQLNDYKKELSDDSFEGKFSLKVSTSINKSSQWSWIYSDPIEVNSGDLYQIITHMKYYNVNQSHIAVEGYNYSNGKWTQLLQVPSGKDETSDWTEYIENFEIPSNFSKLRIVLNAGWIFDNRTENAITWFDDIKIHPVKTGYLDKIFIYSSENKKEIKDLFSKDILAEVKDSKKIDPTKYNVKIKALEPFMLSFSEAYDSMWIAEVKTKHSIKEYRSIPLYNSINGFYIEDIGNLEITIKYKPQDLFRIGSYISILAILFCIVFIIYDFFKNKKIIINKFRK